MNTMITALTLIVIFIAFVATIITAIVKAVFFFDTTMFMNTSFDLPSLASW